MIAPAGPQPSSGSSSVSSGGGGGGGHKQTTIDDLISAVKNAKDENNRKYEQLRDMLYKEPTTKGSYVQPVVYMYYEGNRTNITRTQPIKIMSYIKDTNTQDSMRRVLWLYLQEKKPGATSYEQISSYPQIIGQNDYVYNAKEKYNYTAVVWPEITSFQDLKTVGEIRFMVNLSDGRNKWTTKDEKITDSKPFFKELVLDIINTPPTLENITLVTQNPQPRFKESIKYVASALDNESDPVTVTLHVQDINGTEKANATEIVKAGDEVQFLAGDYGFFSKDDSGKNFTYYYTVSDGINTTNTSHFDGPSIKKSVTINVDDPQVSREDNQYWWQNYNFSIHMRNQEPETAKVQVSLETYTPSHKWRPVASREWDISSNGTAVWYNVQPFFVEDANQPYRYRFMYDEVDQHGGNSREGIGQGKINAKLVKYDIFSVPALLNWLGLFCIAFAGAILIERRFYR
ncbi:Uncharacterised protein [uncultured archaeon]|nr:Uncharacterised protein [uncultured archaeon]